jgi:hypothetical protein
MAIVSGQKNDGAGGAPSSRMLTAPSAPPLSLSNYSSETRGAGR